MATFNIDNHTTRAQTGTVEPYHIIPGAALAWLALPDEGEPVDTVVEQVRMQAASKFGVAALCADWDSVVASNGFVTVTMTV